MITSLIAAVAQNRVIGNQNKLPWHIPTDLAYFKQITQHHPVIMGRKTFESIGRPLPMRKNVIITRQANFTAPPGVEVAQSLEEALVKAGDRLWPKDEAFIIGGAELYREALELGLVDRIYLTDVDAEPEGDSFFPLLDLNKWFIAHESEWKMDVDDEFRHRFLIFEKVKE